MHPHRESKMSYEIQTFPNGHVSLRDTKVGETMHSSIGPWEEAKLLYIEQSKLSDRIRKAGEVPLVIYDVGLGIGANALATLEVFEEQEIGRNVHLISFENDISGLKYALQNIDHFPFLKRHEALLKEFLRFRSVTLHSKFGLSFQWDLCEGSFFNEVQNRPCPELIYYDFYSPKTSPHLWGFKYFDLLFKGTHTRRKAELETTLLTYSSSTAVRSAMLLAGFYVGLGRSTVEKRETTVASTSWKNLALPLGQDWLVRLTRSGKPLPEDWPATDRELAIQKITNQLQISPRQCFEEVVWTK